MAAENAVCSRKRERLDKDGGKSNTPPRADAHATASTAHSAANDRHVNSLKKSKPSAMDAPLKISAHEKPMVVAATEGKTLMALFGGGDGSEEGRATDASAGASGDSLQKIDKMDEEATFGSKSTRIGATKPSKDLQLTDSEPWPPSDFAAMEKEIQANMYKITIDPPRNDAQGSTSAWCVTVVTVGDDNAIEFTEHMAPSEDEPGDMSGATERTNEQVCMCI